MTYLPYKCICAKDLGQLGVFGICKTRERASLISWLGNICIFSLLSGSKAVDKSLVIKVQSS